MPQVRALKSFKGRYGHIRAGSTFTCEPGYAAQLLRSKLIEITGADEPAPSKDRNIPEAPRKGGKGKGKDDGSKPTDPSQADGKGITSASLQAGPASHPKTAPRSAAGGRGTPTPRKKAGA